MILNLGSLNQWMYGVFDDYDLGLTLAGFIDHKDWIKKKEKYKLLLLQENEEWKQLKGMFFNFLFYTVILRTNIDF